MNPAEEAAQAAQNRVHGCLDAGRSFRLEAGAGAGKTYSLVVALKKLIAERGRALQRAGQKVACITYTEVAREEIASEIEQHPAIAVQTIHAFCWSFIRRFQKELRAAVAGFEDDRLIAKIAEAGGVAGQAVEYQLGFFDIDPERISLAHDDVPRLTARFLANPKFRAVLSAAFPVLFIDEYQDTDPHFMKAIEQHFLATGEGPQIGLFGDHWQTIYRNEYRLIEYPGLQAIDKGANFRSAPAVVDVLNRLRPELPQQVRDPAAFGEARFFHTASFAGERTNTRSSKGDTPADVSNALLTKLLGQLQAQGWDLAPARTKILMLTHNAIAAEQGYPTIATSFKHNDAFAKKEDPLIAFLVDTVEPVSAAYAAGRFGDMFRVLGAKLEIKTVDQKAAWSRDMGALLELQANGTIGDVMDHLRATRRPRLPDRVERREVEAAAAEPGAELPRSVQQQLDVRTAPYAELTRLAHYINGHTPFATQHSVKGAEFDNVLVVLGGGWNLYNWPQLFELFTTKELTAKNEGGYFRARNLFYVAVSRPKVRLAVLATQKLPPAAISAAEQLFGAEHVFDIAQ